MNHSTTCSESNPIGVSQLSRESIIKLFPEVDSKSDNLKKNTTNNGSSNDIFDGYDEEQIRLMDEECIVVDWNDLPCGSASKKTCHLMKNINKGLVHRAFSVFLFNSENKLLLQQRADEKITFPGMWTNTCCSHPLYVPSEMGANDLSSSILGAKRAAQRKLNHELGIVKDDVPINKFDFLTRIHYLAPSNGSWGEHEIDYILFIKCDPNLNNVNPNEVKDIKYVSINELKEMFKNPNLSFTPWFKLICESFLFKWWENINDLSSFEDKKIHLMGGE